jgi:hypothetical protein
LPVNPKEILDRVRRDEIRSNLDRLGGRRKVDEGDQNRAAEKHAQEKKR